LSLPGGPAEPWLELPGLLWVQLDAEGRVRWCSPTVDELLGSPASQLLGRRALLLVHPSDLAVVAGAAARVRQGTDVTGVALRLARADGSWCPVVAAGRMVDSGRFDVVARAVDPDRLPGSGDRPDQGPGSGVGADETLARMVLERAPTPMLAVDVAGMVRFVNHELCRVLGVTSPDDLVGQPVGVHRGLAAFAGMAEGGPGSPAGGAEAPPSPDPVGTVEVVTKAGVHRRFVVVRRLVEDEAGRPTAVTAVATDLSDQEVAEARASDRSRVLEAVLAASPDAIAIVDRTGAVLRHNADRLGIFDQPALPARIDDLLPAVHPNDLEAVTERFAELLAGQADVVSVGYRVRHREGRWVAVQSRARMERDDDGRLAHMVIVTRDVSDALAVEQERRRGAEQVAAADRALTETLEDMSLRVRTPLDAVLGFAQLLELDELAPTEAAVLAEVAAAGREVVARLDEALEMAATGAAQIARSRPAQ
jgi:PAS domain S-box-containing protein